MANKVQFIDISQENYNDLDPKDLGTFYRTDENNIYLGEEQLNNTGMSVGGTNLLNGTNICKEITDGTWADFAWSGGGTGIFAGVENDLGITSIEIANCPNSHITTGWLLTNEQDNAENVMIQQRQIPCMQGETYTMSCYARGSGILRLYLTNVSNGYVDYELTDEWIHYDLTCNLSNSDVGRTFYVILGSDDGGGEGSMQICGMKLEVGDTASDWSPAPLDYQGITEITTGTLEWGSFEAPIGTLNDTSWAKIASITEQGLAEQYWSVGDRKAITLNGTMNNHCSFNNETYYAYILGFDHNIELESNGEHTIHFQFGYTDLEGGTATVFLGSDYFSQGTWDDDFHMNTSSTNSGGWELSYMRNTHMPNFEACLPLDLQAVLKEVTKYTNNIGQSSEESAVTATTDRCFLLNFVELGLSESNYQNPYEEKYTQVYDFFRGATNADRIRYYQEGVSSKVDTCPWWSRSANYSNSTYFCGVSFSGTAYYYYAYTSLGLAPAFVV